MGGRYSLPMPSESSPTQLSASPVAAVLSSSSSSSGSGGSRRCRQPAAAVPVLIAAGTRTGSIRRRVEPAHSTAQHSSGQQLSYPHRKNARHESSSAQYCTLHSTYSTAHPLQNSTAKCMHGTEYSTVQHSTEQ